MLSWGRLVAQRLCIPGVGLPPRPACTPTSPRERLGEHHFGARVGGCRRVQEDCRDTPAQVPGNDTGLLPVPCPIMRIKSPNTAPWDDSPLECTEFEAAGKENKTVKAQHLWSRMREAHWIPSRCIRSTARSRYQESEGKPFGCKGQPSNCGSEATGAREDAWHCERLDCWQYF